MPDNYISQIDFGDGVVRKLKAEGGGGGLSSVSFNGVEQTIASGEVDIDGASNLITEEQWMQLVQQIGYILEKPIVSTEELHYTGQPQGPEMIGFDADKCTISNGTNTERGTYTLTISLKDKTRSVWSDGTQNDITAEYTIGMGLPTLSLSQDSFVDWPFKSTDITILGSTGTITGISSNDENIATATLDGNNVTISTVNSGITAISVSMTASQDGNYAAGIAEIPVESKVVPSWSSASDSEIVDILNAHYNDDLDLTKIWNVGDERIISLSAITAGSTLTDSHVAQDVVMVLMNKGGKTLVNPINGHTECAFIVGQKDCLGDGTTCETGMIHGTATNSGGWKNCNRRTWINDTYKNAFPSTILPIFKQHINKYLAGGGTTSTYDSSDYFALPARVEVDGTSTTGYKNEGTLFEYYQDTNHRKKRCSSSVSNNTTWWTRSASTGGTTAAKKVYLAIMASGSIDESNYANVSLGIAPFGVI